MFCDNCGKQFDHTLTNVCPHCGNVMDVQAFSQPADSDTHNSYVDQPQQEYNRPVQNSYTQQQPMDAFNHPLQNSYPQQQPIPNYNDHSQYNQPFDAESDNSGTVLAMGIVGLILAFIPFLNFLGIIFSAIGLGKSKTYLRLHSGIHNGKSKTGKILSIIGLVLSIILTVFISLLIIKAAMVEMNDNYSYYNYYY
ncbi:MAG: hypothetical protein PUC88_02075 [Clostridia bacterium]|nr:hypothetical protein [Clostridia bacterium]